MVYPDLRFKPRLAVLSEEQMEQIHLATLELLERTGVQLTHPRAVEILHGAGARVDGNRVHIPAWMVEDAIQKAKEKIDRSKGYDIEFMVADVRELKSFQNRFDYVVSNQAVHCMKDQEGCIEAIYSLLKQGGKFVCSDISVGLLGFLHHGFHSFLAISKEEWLRILPKYGYINVRVHDIKDFCVAEGQKPFQ